MKVEASRALYEQASMVLVGGVNSPVRALTAVGGTPRFIKEREVQRYKTKTATATSTMFVLGEH